LNTKYLIKKIISLSSTKKRVLIAISGPPGAGKSTLAEAVCHQLNNSGLSAKIIPMDGFHLDNTKLDEIGLRDKKGAPDTFDAEGFVNLVKKLKDNERSVSIPHFNRETDNVAPNQDQVTTEDHILIIEGNYLLLKTEPWSQLKNYFDLTVSINPGIETLRQRLVQRWLDNGHTQEQAEQRALSNDIPNAQTVLNNSSAPDISLR